MNMNKNCTKLTHIAIGFFALVTVLTPSADAVLVEIRADAGNIASIDPNSPESAAGFLVNEPVKFQFTFDLTTPDLFATTGVAFYSDPSAKVRLIGQTSGASLRYADGLDVTLLNNAGIEFRSVSNPANATDTLVIANDIDYIGFAPFFTDVDDLPQVFEDLVDTPFPSRGFTWSTSYWNGSAPVVGMFFPGPPNPATFELIAIPEPSAFLCGGLIAAVVSSGYRPPRRH